MKVNKLKEFIYKKFQKYETHKLLKLFISFTDFNI